MRDVTVIATPQQTILWSYLVHAAKVHTDGKFREIKFLTVSVANRPEIFYKLGRSLPFADFCAVRTFVRIGSGACGTVYYRPWGG